MRPFAGTILLALFALAVRLPAQVANPEPDELRALLESPYASERERGIEELAARLRARPDRVEAWLAEDDPFLRAAALRALIRNAGRVADLRPLVAHLGRLADEASRGEVAAELFAAACDHWDGDEPILEVAAAADPALRRAARSFILERLVELLGKGTLLTEHRVLAAFSVLEPLAGRVLGDLARDDEVYAPTRMLAIGALCRLDATDLFVDAAGQPSTAFQELTGAPNDGLKMAVLYGVAFRGLEGKPMMRELARYAREDAFNEYTIEASLYALYARGAAPLVGLEGEVDLCLKEFLDSFHAQRVRFNAAQLLPLRPTVEQIERALEMVAEEPRYSSYWALAAVFKSLPSLPEERRVAIADRAFALAFRAEGPAQLRALGCWYARAEGRPLPEGLDLEALLATIRASTAALATADEDPDFYAIRSALEILAFLGDRRAIPLIREQLGHESEAVRMAAALAAGQGGFRELCDDLAGLLDRPFEYAACGAATALDQLGDRRGLLFLARYLASGNACLMPAALERLRQSGGKVLAEARPDRPSAWRARSRLWRRELEGRAAGQARPEPGAGLK
ncbi:MAG: HEAT repeat domain-containing protein [Planctomycetes bacterium]|nr:HEAT repeat domain-containing protein [Planctomycetota bacterium]